MSNNPVCDYHNYESAVVSILPQIQKLDGQSIYSLGIDFNNAP